MFLQGFSEHVLHVVGGGAVVAGLIFGLLAILVFLDKRGKKSHREKSKEKSRRKLRGVDWPGQKRKRNKGKR